LLGRRKYLWVCQHGGVLILWAIALPIIFGFIALGVETSLWYLSETDLQGATDAAALAIVYDINSHQDLSIIASAEMARNGFGPETNIAVNHPPQSGAFVGNAHAIEIISTLPRGLLLWNYAFPQGIIMLRARSVVLSSWGLVE
jgi:Putative Flp pilus-assembly TadE/G-like